MRVVGYVREAPGQTEGESAYAQSEKIRRWISDSGHQLVAVCQDIRTPGHALGREGYRALIGIISAGQVDAAIVPSLTAFSRDIILQEIMLWELRGRGVTVLSTDAEDYPLLQDPPVDTARLLLRDVLARVREHVEAFQEIHQTSPLVLRVPEEDTPDVVIELIPSEPADHTS